VFGPYPVADIEREPVYWSPVLEGETATIELELPVTAALGDATLAMPLISHLDIPGGTLRALDSHIGQAGACQVDVACLAPALQQQLATATNAVARIFITVKGVTMICSGTLLNDAQGSFTPYFLTTNHCIDDVAEAASSKGVPAAAASSVNTYWFFQASTCGSQAQPNDVLLAGGAKLLARGADYDWSLLRLNSAPPAGTTFAAWNAYGPLGTGTALAAIHHPSGDLKKVSQGYVFGYFPYPDGSSFIESRWTSGATEAGSSGGGLFVLNSTNSTFELRGALVGGNSSCDFQQGIDQFSRFDVMFPLIQQYLASAAPNPTRIAPVVEFFNATKNDYLITADPAEIDAFDGGTPPGWVRTGLRFLAYTDPSVAPAGAQPVCRFYVPPGLGDTHFLSAWPQECADTVARFGSTWVYESAAAFYVMLPDVATGSCPVNTYAVYRFINNTSALHRRYTAEVDLRDSIIADGGWTQEGFGQTPDQAVMCVPSGREAVALPPTATNFGGIWQGAPAGSQSGWGINIEHQGDVIFATWFTYDASGNVWWLSMTGTRVAGNSFSGILIQTSGPPFFSARFDPTHVTRTPIGAGTLTFNGTDGGTFAYALNGTAQSKTITRFAFGPVPTCTYNAQPDFASATNYQGLWSEASGGESGWGATLTHQGDAIFAVWYTYDANGAPLWLSATATKLGWGVYSGTLYRTTGPAFNSVPFDPARVTRTPVGPMTLTFANGNAATFSYTLDGAPRTKSIARTLFTPPAGTLCQ
jgi:lysyl endopeptidase